MKVQQIPQSVQTMNLFRMIINNSDEVDLLKKLELHARVSLSIPVIKSTVLHDANFSSPEGVQRKTHCIHSGGFYFKLIFFSSF